MSSLPGRYIVTQFLSVCLTVCIFPVKVFFDTSFGILGIVGSIVIEVVSILTGDADQRKLNESVSKNNNCISINGFRRKHYSADDIQHCNGENVRFSNLQNMSNTIPRAYNRRSKTHHIELDCNVPSSPPILKRSETLRSPTSRRSFNFHRSALSCPVHGISTIQKAHSVPLTRPNTPAEKSSFSLSDLFKNCANVFDVFEGYEGSEFSSNNSIASINEMRKKCTCTSSGESSPPSPTLSSEDRSGKKIRVKVNPSLRDRREMQELEKQMAKLERRRHKSGELREMRRKQQEEEQQKSLEINKQEIYVDATNANGDQEKVTSPIVKTIEDAYVSIRSKSSDVR